MYSLSIGSGFPTILQRITPFYEEFFNTGDDIKIFAKCKNKYNSSTICNLIFPENVEILWTQIKTYLCRFFPSYVIKKKYHPCPFALSFCTASFLFSKDDHPVHMVHAARPFSLPLADPWLTLIVNILSNWFSIAGVAHGEELDYLWYQDKLKNYLTIPISAEWKVIEQMTTMWIDYATTG